MSEDLTYKMFTPTDCISEQAMFDYIDNKLSPKEQHAVEKHLLDCEFCSDALEGLRLVKNRNIIGILHKEAAARLLVPVQEQEEKKAAGFNYKIYLSIAAGLLLLLGGVFFFNHFSQNDMKQDVAELKTEQKNQGTEPTDPTPTPPPVAAETTKTTSANSTLQTATPERAKGEPARDVKPGAPVVMKDEAAPNLEQAVQDVSVAEEKNYKKQEADKVTPDGFTNNDQTISANKWEQPTTSSYSYSPASPKAADRKQDYDQDQLKETEQTSSKMRATTKTTAAGKKKGDAKAVENESGLFLNNDAVQAPPDAQSAVADSVNVLVVVDQPAAYPGGQPAMLKFIRDKAKWPEAKATEEITPAKVYVQFVVEKNGTITHPKVLRGINPAFDKEALRLVSLMPNWIPAKLNGKYVASLYTFPITVELK